MASAAQPLLDFTGKVGDALQGKASIGYDDFKNAADAIPGTILAARGAKTGIADASQRFAQRIR